MGWGLASLLQQTADEDTQGAEETGSKTQVTGYRKLDTRHRTQGRITFASLLKQTSDEDTQGHKKQDSGFRTLGTELWTVDTGQDYFGFSVEAGIR